MSEPIELEQEERIKVVRVEDYQALLSVAEELAEALRRWTKAPITGNRPRDVEAALAKFDSFRGVSDG